MKTPIRAPAATFVDDAPPPDIYFLYFDRAAIPARTQDGRPWNPNPYAKLIVKGVVVLETPIQSNDRKPTWPDQVLANYRVTPSDEVLVEVWDAGPVSDQPICSERILHLANMATGGRSYVECDNGARVWLGVEHARSLIGVGLYYELRGSDGGVRVTRVAPRSPAERAGLRAGDQIVSIQGQPVKGLDAFAVRSRINLNARDGLKLDVRSPNGEWRTVTVKEGPIYPLRGDDIELPQERRARPADAVFGSE